MERNRPIQREATILDSVNEGVFTVDPDWRIRIATPKVDGRGQRRQHCKPQRCALPRPCLLGHFTYV